MPQKYPFASPTILSYQGAGRETPSAPSRLGWEMRRLSVGRSSPDLGSGNFDWFPLQSRPVRPAGSQLLVFHVRPVLVEFKVGTIVQIVTTDTDIDAGLFECEPHSSS